MRWALATVLGISLAMMAGFFVGCNGPYLSDRLAMTDLGSTARPVIRGRKASRSSRRNPVTRGNNRRNNSSRRTSAGAVPPSRMGPLIKLTPTDLQPIRSWIHYSNAQWILADHVDVVVSKEFFSQVLTLNEYTGMVKKSERKVGDDLIVTITFRGDPSSASVKSNPRILIGSGLTITARKRLRLRLAKTRSRSAPIRLHVSASGKAVRGRGETSLSRGPNLTIDGALRWTGSSWAWKAG